MSSISISNEQLGISIPIVIDGNQGTQTDEEIGKIVWHFLQKIEMVLYLDSIERIVFNPQTKNIEFVRKGQHVRLYK